MAYKVMWPTHFKCKFLFMFGRKRRFNTFYKLPKFLAGRDLTRITAHAFYTTQWKHLQMEIVFFRNLKNNTFILEKTVRKTQLVFISAIVFKDNTCFSLRLVKCSNAKENTLFIHLTLSRVTHYLLRDANEEKTGKKMFLTCWQLQSQILYFKVEKLENGKNNGMGCLGYLPSGLKGVSQCGGQAAVQQHSSAAGQDETCPFWSKTASWSRSLGWEITTRRGHARGISALMPSIWNSPSICNVVGPRGDILVKKRAYSQEDN